MTGKNKYLPSIVIEELDDIKAEHDIVIDHKAMAKMVEYTIVGREVERLMTLNFKHKPTKAKKGRRSIFDI